MSGIVDEQTIEAVDQRLEADGKTDDQTRRDAVHLIRTRAEDYETDPDMGDVGPKFIVEHALEDAGVHREVRMAVRDELFDRGSH